MRRRAFLAGTLAAGPVAAADPRPFGRGGWRGLLASLSGQPAIVHFWGLTCGPCLAELPAWGALWRDRPKTRLILIAADPVPQQPAQLAATLARANLADAESWAFDGGFSARLFFEVDPTWQGELPRTTLLSGDGRQETWTGSADFDRVRAWLDGHRA